MTTLSHYDGGNQGWGHMILECSECHQIVAEYDCDENGVPTDAVFDYTADHECPAD